MKIFCLAIGARDRASSRLRVWDHLDWFREAGHQVEADSLVPAGPPHGKLRLLARLIRRMPKWALQILRADAVLIQEILIFWPLLLLKNVGKRRRLVFDFSDPVDRHGTGLKGSFLRFSFRRMVSLADVTVVEHPAYVQALAGSGTVAQFYGPVDARRYAEARTHRPRPAPGPGRPLRIGWTGSPGTFAFIAPLMPIIDAIARERAIEVVLMGVDRTGHDFHNAELTLLPWQEAAEFDIVPTFDIGLFRLDDAPSAQWRGAGKLFIYMASGVPFVASNRGIAQGMMEAFGVGYPVATDDQWRQTLMEAIDNPEQREHMSERSIRSAQARMSYESYRAQLLRHLLGQL